MRENKILLLFFFFLFWSCIIEREYVTENGIKYIIRKNKSLGKENSMKLKKGNYLLITFMSDFGNVPIIININDSIIFNGKLKTDYSLGNSLPNIKYDYPPKKLMFIIKKDTFIIPNFSNYKALNVWKYNDKYIFEFSNTFPLLE